MTKKKEVCPYCGKSFTYLSRHKCKVKERLEAPEEEKSKSERRMEIIEEKKKEISRNLKKEEEKLLDIIRKEREIMFQDLIQKSGMRRDQVENILELLSMRFLVKINRELVNSAWTKHVFYVEHFGDKLEVPDQKVDTKRKDFLWNMFGRQPCFICPFTDKCNETNTDIYNPHSCPWLSDWISLSIEGKEYIVDFELYKDDFDTSQ